MNISQLVISFNAWSPSCPETQLWKDWANNSLTTAEPLQIDSAKPQSPEVSFLPIPMRKKLSAMNKIGMFLMHHTLNETQRTTIPIVMSSRFGEVNTMVELLNLIADNQASSPISFSRSVHNATVGLYSIAAKNQSSNSAISAMENSFASGLLEALLQMYALPIGEPVLYCYVDEAMPEIFNAYNQDPPVNYGVAFVLQRSEASPSLRTLRDELDHCECLDFMRKLLQEK